MEELRMKSNEWGVGQPKGFHFAPGFLLFTPHLVFLTHEGSWIWLSRKYPC